MTDRGINMLIAEEVMGWVRVKEKRHNCLDQGYLPDESNMIISSEEFLNYYGDIEAAWQVMEKMFENGWYGGVGTRPDLPGLVMADFLKWPSSDHYTATAPTASQAICLAALKASSVPG